MIKRLFLFSIVFTSWSAFGQQENTSRYESALYQVQVKGDQAFLTQVFSNGDIFSDLQFKNLYAVAMRKEGVIDVRIEPNRESIVIYHLSGIEVETIKEFMLHSMPDGLPFTIGERQDYTMQ